VPGGRGPRCRARPGRPTRKRRKILVPRAQRPSPAPRLDGPVSSRADPQWRSQESRQRQSLRCGLWVWVSVGFAARAAVALAEVGAGTESTLGSLSTADVEIALHHASGAAFWCSDAPFTPAGRGGARGVPVAVGVARPPPLSGRGRDCLCRSMGWTMGRGGLRLQPATRRATGGSSRARDRSPEAAGPGA